MGEQRRYDALRNVPWEVRSSIRDRIGEMPEGSEKVILSLYFISGLSSTEVVRYCEEHNIQSRNHTFYTRRSIQNICNKHFPEARQYGKPNPDRDKRKGHARFIRENPSRFKVCSICGSTENVEAHHKIPLSIGGDDDTWNLEGLCHDCHVATTAYHERIGLFRRGLPKKQ